MIKPLLYVSTAVLLVVAASSTTGPVAQESTQVVQEPIQSVAPDTKNPVKPTSQTRARAKEIYSVDCALCHGENGNGKTDVAKGMGLSLGDWTDHKTLAAKPDGELFNIIRNGKGKMPSEAQGRAKDFEVWSLIQYIRSMPSKEEPAAAPAAAEN
jgi:mono/diheme cytochrome c family protein